jgi:formiminotetrahydrofolate cyclodeaminase
VALHLAHAALSSALLTVDVNLPFLRDAQEAESIGNRRKILVSHAERDYMEGLHAVSSRSSDRVDQE